MGTPAEKLIDDIKQLTKDMKKNGVERDKLKERQATLFKRARRLRVPTRDVADASGLELGSVRQVIKRANGGD